MVLKATHFIDDSGAEDDQYTVMGGPVFLASSVFSFHYEWERIATTLHGVPLPIHMRDFFRPNGRLAYLSDSERRALFHDLVYLINRTKVCSLTVAVNNKDFQTYFPLPQYRKHMEAEAFGFLWCIILNHCILKDHRTDRSRIERMAYTVAKSNLNPQIEDCHAFFVSTEIRKRDEYTGSLAIRDPRDVYALQAADMIAWANLKKHRGYTFAHGFEPLELLTRYVESQVKPIIHFHYPITAKSQKSMVEIWGAPKPSKGARVSFLGIIAPELKPISDRTRLLDE